MPADLEFEGLLGDLEGLDEAKLRLQIEQAHQVEMLTQHPGWTMYCDYLTALTVTRQRRILGGRCEGIEDYRYLTGQVSGLTEAMEAPANLMKRIRLLQEQVQQASNPSDDDE